MPRKRKSAFMSTAPSARWLFGRPNWRRSSKASSVRIPLPSISTNGAQVPYDAGFLLVADGELHRDTFTSPAAYLRRATRGIAAGSPWPSEYGPDLSRGFRALKTWFTLKDLRYLPLGRRDRAELARSLAISNSACAANRYWSCSPRRSSTSFAFDIARTMRMPSTPKIVADLQESGIAAPSTTTIGGKFAIRAAFVNHRTQIRDVDALVDAVLRLGEASTPL